jgi:4-hydroxybenzoyl-CoA thioesterase
MHFERDKTLHFQHCDPAGIIFYPQYFVLFHEVLEDWFTEGLDTPYGDYIRHQRLGVPTVKTAGEFFVQAYLGDRLSIRLQCVRLGGSSLDYVAEAWRGSELCARGSGTIVQISLDTRRSVPFAPALRERIGRFLAPPTP